VSKKRDRRRKKGWTWEEEEGAEIVALLLFEQKGIGFSYHGKGG
jgi:hypothetical protein